MTLYRAYGLVLESALALGPLEVVADAVPDIHFVVETAGDPEPVATWRWHQDDPWGHRSLSVARDGARLLLRFWDRADFAVELPGLVRARPLPGLDLAEVEHLLLDQVLPRLRNSRDAAVVHASAVDLAGGAVAFSAMSGGGKSTLAHAVATSGGVVMSDDALVLRAAGAGGIEALAGYRGVRLRPFADSPFKTRRPTPFAGGTRPLRRIYFLDECESIAVEVMGGRETVLALTRQGLFLDAHDPAELRRGFEIGSELARRRLVRRLAYPRVLESLPGVLQAIACDLAAD